MNNTLKNNHGRFSAARCADFVSQPRSILVQAYWQIGGNIVKVEQRHGSRAKYGKYIIESLLEDLTKRYGSGSGFSVSNLNHMRNFYVTYSIIPPAGQLEWSKHVVLLTVKDEKKRGEIEKMARKVFF